MDTHLYMLDVLNLSQVEFVNVAKIYYTRIISESFVIFGALNLINKLLHLEEGLFPLPKKEVVAKPRPVEFEDVLYLGFVVFVLCQPLYFIFGLIFFRLQRGPLPTRTAAIGLAELRRLMGQG